MLGNPILLNDPSGHWACEDAYSCAHSDTIESQELAEKRRRNHRQKLIDDASYVVDNLAATVAYTNMVVTDVTMAIIAGEGCLTGAGCLPAVGAALGMDYLMTTVTPFGTAENILGALSTALAVVGDISNGTTFVSSDGTDLNIGIGRDNGFAATNAARGTVPEVNYDVYVNSQQLKYDNARRSGQMPAATQVNVRIPLDWLFSASVHLLG